MRAREVPRTAKIGEARVLRILRSLLPVVAIVVFTITVRECFRVARGAGHLEVYDQMGWHPVISYFGNDEPERTIFRRGFTTLALVLATTLGTRALQLRGHRAIVRRGAAVLFGIVAVASLLVMTWIPDAVSPIHFFAALATFFFLSGWELVEASLIATAARARGVRALDVAMLAWCFACPLLSVAAVVRWITQADVLAQYAAVALQFAWFLGAIPELARRDGSRAMLA